MPYGAYKINAWGGNLNDAPVIPNGLTVYSDTITIPTSTAVVGPIPNPTTQNYNNQVGFFGFSNNRLYFAIGVSYGASLANTTSLVTLTIDSGTPSLVQNLSTSNTARGNNEIACAYADRFGNGQYYGIITNTWNNAATATGVRVSALGVGTAFSSNTGGTTFTAGNTVGADILPCSNFDKGKAVTYFINPSSTSSTGPSGLNILWFGVSNEAGTNYLRSYQITSVPNLTAAMSISNANAYNIKDGVRICGFTKSGGGGYAAYIGYNLGDLYLGTFDYVNATTITQSSVSLSMTYSTRNVMIMSLWNDFNTSTYISVIQHSDQYLRFVKFTGFGSSMAYTSSQDFLISSSPNSSYRVCATGIDGLGCIVYLGDFGQNIYIRFFSVPTTLDTIVWGNPILLAANPVPNTVIFNADCKYASQGFGVGVFVADANGNNKATVSYLYPLNTRAQATSIINNLPTPFTGNTNVYLETTVKKFGTSSLRLDSAVPPQVNFPSKDVFSTIGTGNYTVECWFYCNPAIFGSSTGLIFHIGNTPSTIFFQIGVNTSNQVTATYANTTTITGGSFTTNTWSHLAFVNVGGTATLYLNGASVGTNTGAGIDWANITATRIPTIGSNSGSTYADTYNGFIDEFRISKTARYTGSSFTVPTSSFSNDVDTVCLLHFNGRLYYRNLYDDFGPAYSG